MVILWCLILGHNLSKEDCNMNIHHKMFCFCTPQDLLTLLQSVQGSVDSSHLPTCNFQIIVIWVIAQA